MSDEIKEFLLNTHRDVCALAFELQRDKRLQTPDGRNFGTNLLDAVTDAVAQITGEVLSKSDEVIFEEAIRKLMTANEAAREFDKDQIRFHEDTAEFYRKALSGYIQTADYQASRILFLQDELSEFACMESVEERFMKYLNSSCDCQNMKSNCTVRMDFTND